MTPATPAKPCATTLVATDPAPELVEDVPEADVDEPEPLECDEVPELALELPLEVPVVPALLPEPVTIAPFP